MEDFEKEIKGESDSLRRRYLTKMKNDTLAELATERNLVVEDAKDAIISTTLSAQKKIYSVPRN